MIECPNCTHQEYLGALFCSECGTQLIHIQPKSTKLQPVTFDDNLTEEEEGQFTSPAASTPNEAAISLFLFDTGEIIPLVGKTEYTLGRSAEGQPILPDIDLTHFKAYESGVSRLHVTLTFSKQEVLATDLGSANGTYLNRQKLLPHRAYPVNHQDILTLGKLKIQLLIRK